MISFNPPQSKNRLRLKNQTSTISFLKLFSFYAILTVKLIDTSACSSSFLLSGVERMALGADFYVDIFLCRSCYEFIAAVADNLCLMVLRMDSFSHNIHLFIIVDGFQPSLTKTAY